ncbi:DNA alkylation repair protein [Falsirhodobacter algicola]|uniref:DNA alkylation repair protein n=1 Tax=Falsirhodobacter algicola TaxID=2692330 RepID=A0A8J8MS59_9RHOB|nr:DNA alkylation repair protein [Falsirhodobacter algicola]QUS35529.1 DNA alkylation repair protein [Falsirhodobacter algicola]
MNAVEALRAQGNEDLAAAAAERHGGERTYLGTPNAAIDALVAEWRADLSVEERVALASSLWHSDVHEARIAAARLLLQARMRPDEPAWRLVQAWLPDLDVWAIADAVGKAAEKRVMADLDRLETVKDWTLSENPWMRRCALMATAPLAKKNHPKPAENAARDEVLDWIVDLLQDRDWHVQKAIAAWLRDLSRHDPDRLRSFLAEHSEAMRGFTRKDVAKLV